MVRQYFSIVSCLLLIALLIPNVAGACPSCKLVEDPITRGFNWSILFLMAMPFAVFGLIGGGVVYVYKRGNQTANSESRTDEE